MVILLVLAVALTTALVLAGERPNTPEKQTAYPQPSSIFAAARFTGSHAC
jgi:hypothetical protein